MKKLLLSILLATSFDQLSAQNEYLQSNPEWTVYHGFGAFMPCIEHDTMLYYLNGDSIINALTYKQVWKCSHKWYSWMSPNPNPGCGGHIYYCDTMATGFIRSQGQQMYYIPRGDTSEQLLYDFNLTVGSPLPVTYTFCCPTTETITSIDSIYTPYGYRKRYFIDSNPQDFLVEGIGSSHGLLEPWGIWLDNVWTLLCYSLNDTAWFPGQGPACSVLTTVPAITQQEISLQLVPNPATDYVDVQLTGINIDLVELFDVNGKKVKSQAYYRIGTESLNSGIYFVRVTAGENVVTEKLLIE
jgi:hypothetical protein